MPNAKGNVKQKQKPIIFSHKEARLILDGQKTQFRLLLKPQPTLLPFIDGKTSHWHWKDCRWLDGGIGFPKSGLEDYASHKVGDILYVREPWTYLGVFDGVRDISDEDCKAEGLSEKDLAPAYKPDSDVDEKTKMFRCGFLEYCGLKSGWQFAFWTPWNKKHGSKENGFIANPWVWVVEFEINHIVKES